MGLINTLREVYNRDPKGGLGLFNSIGGLSGDGIGLLSSGAGLVGALSGNDYSGFSGAIAYKINIMIF